jgi:hypothetical protein
LYDLKCHKTRLFAAYFAAYLHTHFAGLLYPSASSNRARLIATSMPGKPSGLPVLPGALKVVSLRFPAVFNNLFPQHVANANLLARIR